MRTMEGMVADRHEWVMVPKGMMANRHEWVMVQMGKEAGHGWESAMCQKRQWHLVGLGKRYLERQWHLVGLGKRYLEIETSREVHRKGNV